MQDKDKVELRGFVDPLIIQVLDAIKIATGKTRTQILEPILIDWAKSEILASQKIMNVTNAPVIKQQINSGIIK